MTNFFAFLDFLGFADPVVLRGADSSGVLGNSSGVARCLPRDSVKSWSVSPVFGLFCPGFRSVLSLISDDFVNPLQDFAAFRPVRLETTAASPNPGKMRENISQCDSDKQRGPMLMSEWACSCPWFR